MLSAFTTAAKPRLQELDHSISSSSSSHFDGAPIHTEADFDSVTPPLDDDKPEPGEMFPKTKTERSFRSPVSSGREQSADLRQSISKSASKLASIALQAISRAQNSAYTVVEQTDIRTPQSAAIGQLHDESIQPLALSPQSRDHLLEPRLSDSNPLEACDSHEKSDASTQSSAEITPVPILSLSSERKQQSGVSSKSRKRTDSKSHSKSKRHRSLSASQRSTVSKSEVRRARIHSHPQRSRTPFVDLRVPQTAKSSATKRIRTGVQFAKHKNSVDLLTAASIAIEIGTDTAATIARRSLASISLTSWNVWSVPYASPRTLSNWRLCAKYITDNLPNDCWDNTGNVRNAAMTRTTPSVSVSRRRVLSDSSLMEAVDATNATVTEDVMNSSLAVEMTADGNSHAILRGFSDGIGGDELEFACFQELFAWRVGLFPNWVLWLLGYTEWIWLIGWSLACVMQFVSQLIGLLCHFLLCFTRYYEPKKYIHNRMKQRFPYATMPCGIKKHLCLVDSGLLILSNVAADDSGFEAYEVSSAEDALSEKGFLWSWFAAYSLLVVNTHLQAAGSVDDVRTQQLLQMKRFLDTFRARAERIIVCGDFNVDMSAFKPLDSTEPLQKLTSALSFNSQTDNTSLVEMMHLPPKKVGRPVPLLSASPPFVATEKKLASVTSGIVVCDSAKSAVSESTVALALPKLDVDKSEEKMMQVIVGGEKGLEDIEEKEHSRSSVSVSLSSGSLDDEMKVQATGGGAPLFDFDLMAALNSLNFESGETWEVIQASIESIQEAVDAIHQHLEVPREQLEMFSAALSHYVARHQATTGLNIAERLQLTKASGYQTTFPDTDENLDHVLVNDDCDYVQVDSSVHTEIADALSDHRLVRVRMLF